MERREIRPGNGCRLIAGAGAVQRPIHLRGVPVRTT